MTTKTVSLLISELNTGSPKHCVAAPQLETKTLPQPVGSWKKVEVTLEGSTITMVKTSGGSEDERVYVKPREVVGLFKLCLIIGDSSDWKMLDATSYPPVHALLSAMQGNTEDADDGPFAMNTMLPAPNLRLVYAE
ncbi:MAG: hypothetical protein EON60_11480 [Alphaproteobacteria bacterium]|nr:MAG: hypothetical protein EON60_11480 [Alphaproteobacteria bacterium]